MPLKHPPDEAFHAAETEATHPTAAVHGDGLSTTLAPPRSTHTHTQTSATLLSKLQPQTRFADRFMLLRPLGEGGMGIVYLARDTILERNVAIKTLRADHLDDARRLTWMQTFRREATSTARLQHPHILSLHDFGVETSRSNHGIPFLVLEHLRGQPLDHVLRRGPLRPTRVLHFAKQLTSALVHAHHHGVIHRDLKPSNLFIEAGDHLRVMDFGVALLNTDPQQLVEAFGLNDEDLTARLGHTPSIAGTPLYMAPEQVLGDVQDTRVDIWATGVVIFEMLTGQLPFAHPMYLLKADVQASFPTHVDVPEVLSSLVMRCLKHAVDERFPSAQALLDALMDVDRLTLQPVATSPLTNIATPTNAFVGRRGELARLRSWFDTDHRSLITLVGPGGVGKTRLAAEFARRTMTCVDQAICCDFTHAHDLDGMVFAMGRALDVPLRGDQPVRQLSQVLASRGQLLMVLDNLEHLMEHINVTIGVWLEHAPKVRWLVTSRQRLGLLDEVVLVLPPMALPKAHTLADVVTNDAVELFVRRAQAHAPNFRVHEHNASDVASLVCTLDGLPLALELAAARCHVLSPARMLAKMNRRFSLLRSKRRDIDPRQATLEATMLWSWALLEPWEQATLGQVSVFEGGFSSDAAEAVVVLDPWPQAPCVTDILHALVDKSLVAHHTEGLSDHATLFEGTRFRLLLSIQAFAQQQMYAFESSHGDASSIMLLEHTQRRHVRFFSHMAKHDVCAKLAPLSLHVLRRWRLEVDNLLAAKQWACRDQDWDLAINVMRVLVAVLEMSGPFQVGIDALSDVLKQPLTPVQRGDALELRGRLRLAGRAGGGGIADELQESVTLAQHAQDHQAAGRRSGWLGVARFAQGRLDEALELFEKSIEYARQQGDAYAIGRRLVNWANAASELGRLDDAIARFQEAIDQTRVVGDVRTEGLAWGNLADLYMELGRFEEARAGFQRAVAMTHWLDDWRLQCLWLGEQELLERDHFKRFDVAAESLDRALVLARRTDNVRFEGIWQGERALVDLLQGNLDAARRGFDNALEIATTLDDERAHGIWLGYLARLHIQCEDHVAAYEAFAQGEAKLRAVGDRLELAKLLAYRGHFDVEQGQLHAAANACREAADTADAFGVRSNTELASAVNALTLALDAATVSFVDG